MSNNETKRQPAVTTTYDDATGVFSVAFADGRSHSFPLSSLAPEIALRATIHGLNAKFVDAAAIARDPNTGRTATLDTKHDAVMEVVLRVTDPEAPAWNKTREGGAGGGGSLLVAALVRMYKGRKTDEQIRAYLATLTDAQKQALRNDPAIAPIIRQIKDEREAARGQKASGIDSRALLAGLDAIGDDDDEEDESAPM